MMEIKERIILLMIGRFLKKDDPDRKDKQYDIVEKLKAGELGQQIEDKTKINKKEKN